MDAHSSKSDKNKHFFEAHLQLLNLAGILPRPALLASPWKATCYNTFSIVALLVTVANLFAALFAIYQNWGDISVVTGIFFQVSFVVNCISVYVYLILNRKTLQTILSKSEEAVSRHIKYVGLDRMSLYDTLMAQAYRQNSILTRTILTISANMYIFWTLYPLILWCTKTENEIQDVENSEIKRSYNDGQWKYFCYRIWLPHNATQTPMYQFIYIDQAFEIYFTILVNATHNLMTISLMLYLTSQFKVLTAYLEMVDDVPINLKEISGCEISGTEPQEYSESGKEETIKKSNRNVGHVGRYEVLHREENDWSVETESFEVLHIQDDEEIYRYLVNCVKHHQHLLQ